MTNESPKRRWFQLKLRTLLIVVLVLSLPLSWFAVKTERARRQRLAVEAIQELGGSVGYDWELYVPGKERSPLWLCTRLEVDFLHDVVAVDLVETYATNAELAYLTAARPNLYRLDLDDTQIIDGGLAHLKELANLISLSLDRTLVTDAGLEHLKGLTNLGGVYLFGTDVTEGAVSDLERVLPNCSPVQWDGLLDKGTKRAPDSPLTEYAHTKANALA